MKISSIINQYHDKFITKYGGVALPGHLKAMNAIRNCRTPASGEALRVTFRLRKLLQLQPY